MLQEAVSEPYKKLWTSRRASFFLPVIPTSVIPNLSITVEDKNAEATLQHTSSSTPSSLSIWKVINLTTGHDHQNYDQLTYSVHEGTVIYGVK